MRTHFLIPSSPTHQKNNNFFHLNEIKLNFLLIKPMILPTNRSHANIFSIAELAYRNVYTQLSFHYSIPKRFNWTNLGQPLRSMLLKMLFPANTMTTRQLFISIRADCSSSADQWLVNQKKILSVSDKLINVKNSIQFVG